MTKHEDSDNVRKNWFLSHSFRDFTVLASLPSSGRSVWMSEVAQLWKAGREPKGNKDRLYSLTSFL